MSNQYSADIPKGLNVPKQVRLDSITSIQNEEALKNLGPGNNLAFKYYDGLKVYCKDEKTEYIWREVEGIETGLLDNHFTYPTYPPVDGIDYSGKTYNFFPIINLEGIQDLQSVLDNGNAATFYSSEQDVETSYTFSPYGYIFNQQLGDYTFFTVMGAEGGAFSTSFNWNNLGTNYSSSFQMNNPLPSWIVSEENNNDKFDTTLTFEKPTNQCEILIPSKQSRVAPYILATLDDISNVEQNNFVRTITILEADLPNNYTENDICDYILALPANQRTILETDSKWNVVVTNFVS